MAYFLSLDGASWLTNNLLNSNKTHFYYVVNYIDGSDMIFICFKYLFPIK